MNYYMLCWSNEGFEAIVDVTDYHPENFDVTRAIERLADYREAL